MPRLRKLLFALLLIRLLTPEAKAAFGAGMQWDVRTTGSDANGGGFDSTVVAPGTDYSVQDAAQQAYTDIVVGGTTTQGTSVAHPFGATSPGNVVNITAGAGCTVQRAEILSVSGVTATFDKSLGTAASVCTGNLGGGLLTIAVPIALIVAHNGTNSNGIHIKTGTYTQTTAITMSTATVTITGYGTTHGDGGTKPLITTATNSTHIFSWPGAATPFFQFRNLSLSNTAATPFDAFIGTTGNVGGVWVDNCKFDGFRHVINGDFAVVWNFPALRVTNSEVKNGTSSQILTSIGGFFAYNYFHDNTGDAINLGSSTPTGPATIDTNVFYKNTTGINAPSSSPFVVSVTHNVFSDQTTAGVLYGNVTGPFLLDLVGNIFYANGTYGVDFATTFSQPFNQTNAYGANTTAARRNFSAGTGDVTLTADPFTARTANNFALNATAGGGAALKGVGYPGSFSTPLSAGTGYIDIGAFQSQGAAASGGNYAVVH